MKLPIARLLPAITGASCLWLCAACGGGSGANGGDNDSEGPPTGDREPPPPEFVVRGELFSFDTGMIADTDINLWVQTPGFGFSYWWANGPLRSDGLGLFEAPVPQSSISILAVHDDFVQPCAVRSKVDQDVEVRIEMLPISALNVVNAPRPQLSSDPSVTGTIYESTPAGRQAIAGAELWAQDAMEIGLATTRSDRGGGFYLCNLPAETYIDIRKVGYRPVLVGPIGGREPAVLEIELVREFDTCPHC
jgi:hypothetical protein